MRFAAGQMVDMSMLTQDTILYAIWERTGLSFGDPKDGCPANPDDPSKSGSTIHEGDPVNILTGDFIWEYTDVTLHGNEELAFSRTYHSREEYSGALGSNWRHSFDYYVKEDSSDDLTLATVYIPNGYKVTFTRNANG